MKANWRHRPSTQVRHRE